MPGQPNTFGTRVRQLRDARSMSVRELATLLERSPGYISRIEVRGEIPSPELTCKLAEALEVSAEELLELARANVLQRMDATLQQRQETALRLFRRSK